jgi:YVTN family beta-propeller protein
VPGVSPELLQPVGLSTTSDGKHLFVALGPANRVAVVDAESFEVLDYLLVGQRVWQLALTPDERYLFTTNGNTNDVSVIDVADLSVVRSIPVGEQPWGVAVSPE